MSASTLKTAKVRKRKMQSAKFKLTQERSIELSLKLLKRLRDAEWMVTHDWGGNRQAILEQVDALLDAKWAKAYFKGWKNPDEP